MSGNQSKPDQYQLRFPPGLRDRVKAYAELQGRSMNAEIIRILENEFPEPEGIEDRVSMILSLVAILRSGVDQGHINRLSSELLDAVRAISDGTIQGVDEKDRKQISQELERWEEAFADNQAAVDTVGLDEVEVEALSRGRSKAKYPLDREWRRYARSFEGRELSEAEEDAFERGFERGFKFSNQVRHNREDGGDLDDGAELRGEKDADE